MPSMTTSTHVVDCPATVHAEPAVGAPFTNRMSALFVENDCWLGPFGGIGRSLPWQAVRAAPIMAAATAATCR